MRLINMKKNGNNISSLFKLKKEEINKLIPDMGYCFASNKITIDGLKVGYMYREEPTDATDSGWRFFSGTESQAYVDNPDNFKIYDVNTIVNYDDSIIPYLSSSVGTELVKVDSTFKCN